MLDPPSSGGCKMRKYHQLVLLVFSIISILCFVFYKHEYDRLRKVLEVLDFFGSPITEGSGNSLLPQKECINGSVQFINDFWHTYEDEIHVYSAFKASNEKGWSLNSLTVVGRDSSTAKKRASCALISGDGTEDKFEGTIEWKKIGNDTTSSAYSIICNVPEMQSNGHLFALYDEKSNSQLKLPLHLGPDQLKNRAVSLCVISNDPYWQASDIVDFILYYEKLGVENVFIYHRGIGDQVVSSLKVLVVARANLTIYLAPWNRPSSSLDLQLVHHDCAWRHGAKTGPVVALPMAHYLVLPPGSSLATFLAKIDRQDSEHIHEARIERQSLCSNLPNAESSPLRLPRMMKNPIKKEIPRAVLRWTEGLNHPGRSETVKVNKIDPHSAKILVFEPCSVSGAMEKTEDDPVVRRFSAFVQNIPHYKVRK